MTKLYFSSGPSKEESARPMFQYDSLKEIQVQHDSRATATLQTATELSKDARAIRERALKQPISSEKAGGEHGPLRASAYIRVSARFDNQPEICKDCKETGYCGYGDSCKFMHDRGDYKFGWQLEKEWEEAEKARKGNLALGGDADTSVGHSNGDDDALQFACFACRRPFQDPVVTKCKHYFCQHCALKHHSTSKKCFVCNKPTLGIFNTAHEIHKKMAEDENVRKAVSSD